MKRAGNVSMQLYQQFVFVFLFFSICASEGIESFFFSEVGEF